MANSPLQTEDEPSMADIGRGQSSDRLAELEEAVEAARGVLTAISEGGLLHEAPAAPAAYERHSAATALLQLLGARLDALAL
jgi:hypothetical protein